MYVPARSDLLSLAISAIITCLLLLGIETAHSAAVIVAALIAVPFVPVLAAWVSGPAHSLRSRFVFRGVAAITGMAAAVFIAVSSLAEPYDISRVGHVFFAALWALVLSALSLVFVLIGHALLREPDASA